MTRLCLCPMATATVRHGRRREWPTLHRRGGGRRTGAVVAQRRRSASVVGQPGGQTAARRACRLNASSFTHGFARPEATCHRRHRIHHRHHLLPTMRSPRGLTSNTCKSLLGKKASRGVCQGSGTDRVACLIILFPLAANVVPPSVFPFSFLPAAHLSQRPPEAHVPGHIDKGECSRLRSRAKSCPL